MHQDPFVSTGGLSFHPPTPSNIIASKSRDGIYRSPLSLSLRRSSSNFSLQKFLLPEKRSKTIAISLDNGWRKEGRKREGKGRKGGIGNGEEDGDRRVQLIGPGTSCPSSSTLDSWESRPPQASSAASSFCATIRRFFFIQKRFLAIPFLDPYPTLSIDRFRVPFPFYAERDVDREVGWKQVITDERKLTLNFCFFEVNDGINEVWRKRKKENGENKVCN